MEVGEVASFKHFILYCFALANLRLTHFGRRNCAESSELAGIGISRFKKFVICWKRFLDLWASIHI